MALTSRICDEIAQRRTDGARPSVALRAVHPTQQARVNVTNQADAHARREGNPRCHVEDVVHEEHPHVVRPDRKAQLLGPLDVPRPVVRDVLELAQHLVRGRDRGRGRD